MPPIKEYSAWNKRHADEIEEIEPLRKYIFVCEGSKTEVFYFKHLIERSKQLDLHPLIDLRLWEKTGEDETLSSPHGLIRFAEREKDNPSQHFDRSHDRMVVVFDLDVFSRVGDDRVGAVEKAAEFALLLDEAANDILAVTNPSFELFLLLHRPGAFENLVQPNAEELLENRKIGKQRFAQRLFTDAYGINPKTNPHIGELANCVDTAIEEERHLNHSIETCLDELTSTVGKVIEDILNDRPAL